MFKRGYDKLLPGKRVLVVEDILTTGGSARQVVDLVTGLGGTVIGLGALCNRGNVTASALNVPLVHVLCNVQLETWAEEECPLCEDGRPINTHVGHGAAYMALQKRNADRT